MQWCRNQGGPLAPPPPIFVRSFNPFGTGEGRLSPPITTGTPKVFHLPASLLCTKMRQLCDLFFFYHFVTWLYIDWISCSTKIGNRINLKIVWYSVFKKISNHSLRCGFTFYSKMPTIRENKTIFKPSDCIAQLGSSVCYEENDEQ